jgi:hypothetical protein
MATLHITEFESLQLSSGGEHIQVVKLPAIRTTVVTFTTATLSGQLSARTVLVRLYPSADAYFQNGPNTTVATTESIPVTAKAAEYFEVTPSSFISVVTQA